MSRRQKLKIPYEAIMEVARPGDIVFLISDAGRLKHNTWFHREYRRWLGFDALDTTFWHTSVYVGPRKESKGAAFRPYIVHAIPKGTVETYVPPEYFRNTVENEILQHNRLEIIQSTALEPAAREKIVAYCREKLGKPFDNDERWYRNIATLLLGIRSLPMDPGRVSCHGLAFEAYQLVGMRFAHQLAQAPNLWGRMFGHPLGHPKDAVNLRSNYLRDHYLYRDARFSCAIAIADTGSDESLAITLNPPKYSWNPVLQRIYGCQPVHSESLLSEDCVALSGKQA